MASQSETLLSPSVIHPTRTVCLTQPEPAAILIDDSDSEDSIDEHEPERAPINTRGRKRQREDEPQSRRKRLRTSVASEATSNSEDDVIDLTSERDVIDVETAPSASRVPLTPLTTRNASYPPSHASPLNSLMRSFGMGQYHNHLPSYLLHSYQHHPPAAAIDFLFSALPSTASLRSSYDEYREPVENVEARFGGGYWSRRRQQQQQLNRSSSSTGSNSQQQGPVTVVDIDDDEPVSRSSATSSGGGSEASTKSPDKPNNATENKTAAATVADLTKDLKCAICLGAIENITATVCGHIFCEGCILPAIEIQRKCPICRTHLTKKSIHPLFF